MQETVTKQSRKNKASKKPQQPLSDSFDAQQSPPAIQTLQKNYIVLYYCTGWPEAKLHCSISAGEWQDQDFTQVTKHACNQLANKPECIWDVAACGAPSKVNPVGVLLSGQLIKWQMVRHPYTLEWSAKPPKWGPFSAGVCGARWAGHVGQASDRCEHVAVSTVMIMTRAMLVCRSACAGNAKFSPVSPRQHVLGSASDNGQNKAQSDTCSQRGADISACSCLLRLHQHCCRLHLDLQIHTALVCLQMPLVLIAVLHYSLLKCSHSMQHIQNCMLGSTILYYILMLNHGNMCR